MGTKERTEQGAGEDRESQGWCPGEQRLRRLKHTGERLWGSVRRPSSAEGAHSPQGEGSLLVPTHAVPVDGGGTRHCVQMVGAVGQGGDPLAVPLGLLLPGDTGGESHPSDQGLDCAHSDSLLMLSGTTVP